MLAAGAARAHRSSLAYSEIVVSRAAIDYTIRIADTDLYEAVGVETDRPVTRAEVLAGRERLFAYLIGRVHIEDGGVTCPAIGAGLDFVSRAEGFFAAARLRFRCPRPLAAARLRYELFFDVDPRHQGIAHIVAGDGTREVVFRDGSRTVPLRALLPGPLDQLGQYLVLGVEHIFTGYDHVAFLFALLVVAAADGLRRGARRILGVVTAFTLAHSVTLIASALGSTLLTPLRVVPAIACALVARLFVEPRCFATASRPARRARVLAAALAGYLGAALVLAARPTMALDPGRVVEAAIALSIAWVAVENLLVRAPAHRFLLTLCFGLVHGFGFASALREVGLPERGLLVCLLAFNAGVELGQLAIVLALLPLLANVAHPRRRPPLVEAAAVALAALATLFALRRFGVPAAPLTAVTLAVAMMYAAGRRWGYERVVRRGGSALVGALALLWLCERVLGRELLGGRLG